MDEHYHCIELNISVEEFHRLPQNAAYKYEYFGGRAVLSPRPKQFSCVRELAPVHSDPVQPVVVEPLARSGIAPLADLFRAAMSRVQPFASLDKKTAHDASMECLRKTVADEDGPLIEAACFQAFTERHGDVEAASGAILITLVPEKILTVPYAGMWRKAPPADAVERKLGVPHLTWVFVTPWEGRHGIATALLARSVEALREMGFEQLTSTFLLDNGPSMLWHWRHDFALLPGWTAFMRDARTRHEVEKPVAAQEETAPE